MNLVENIVQWHHDRNLIEGATDKGQFKKLMSEFGELSDNLAKGRCVKDDIGDIGVVIINIAERNGNVESLVSNHLTCHLVEYMDLFDELNQMGHTIYNETERHYKVSIEESLIECWESLKGFAKCNNINFDECLAFAYDDIKDRKGKIVNGTFVKESDHVKAN